MKMIIFTGGTLGHIMPAIVLIKEIKKRYQDSYIVVVATSKDQDYEIFRTKDIDKIYFLNASKASFNILKQIKNLKVYHEIKNIIKKENVEIAYGFGGYISGIGMLAAKFSKLKTYLHEQNSVMGKANKILSKVVDKVFLSYPVKEMKKNYFLVGNPVFINAKKTKQNIYKEKRKILFTSGTLGAKVINDLAINLINNGYLKEYEIYIITGKKYYDNVIKKVNNPRIHIMPFCNNLINEIASSEIVVSRAGSSTLFEILGTNTLSIIIPSINVTDNHQYFNAVYFNNLGMIEMIEEKDLTMSNFINKLHLLNTDKISYINRMKEENFNKVYDFMIEGVLNEM